MASKIQFDINRQLNSLKSFTTSAQKFSKQNINNIEKSLRSVFLKFRTEKDSKVCPSIYNPKDNTFS